MIIEQCCDSETGQFSNKYEKFMMILFRRFQDCGQKIFSSYKVLLISRDNEAFFLKKKLKNKFTDFMLNSNYYKA